MKTRFLTNHLLEKALEVFSIISNDGLPSFPAPDELSGSEREALRLALIAQPVNVQAARRRSCYNPNTIARDVLISSGEHPTERALNAHLECLVDRFKHVDSRTDLNTFRWDLVDPSPPEFKIMESIETDEGENTQLPVGQSSCMATFAPSEGPKRKFKSILTSIRGRGKGRGLSRGGRLGAARLDSYRTATSRDGRMIPGEFQNLPQSLHPTSSPILHKKSKMEHCNADVEGESSVNESENVVSVTAASADVLTSSMRCGGVLRNDGAGPEVPRRAAKIALSRGPIQRGSKTTQQSGAKNGHHKLRSKTKARSPASKNSPFTRPPGWLHDSNVDRTISVDKVAVIVPSLSPNFLATTLSYVEEPRMVEKKLKKWDSDLPSPNGFPDTGTYPVFRCKWVKCTSGGLHNLATLRKHVFKLHTSKSKPNVSNKLSCCWAGCAGCANADDQDKPSDFEDVQTLEKHIEEVHLKEIAWKLGDGPSSHPPG